MLKQMEWKIKSEGLFRCCYSRTSASFSSWVHIHFDGFFGMEFRRVGVMDETSASGKSVTSL